MIRFENIVKSLGGRVVLNGIDFEVNRGETFVILGPSGTGKSVSLKHMVKLMTPDEGRVLIDGEAINEAEGRDLERIRERFGVLFQGGALLAWMTVFDNVALPLREKTKMRRHEIKARVEEVLAMVGLQDDGKKLPANISGGMKKRYLPDLIWSCRGRVSLPSSLSKSRKCRFRSKPRPSTTSSSNC